MAEENLKSEGHDHKDTIALPKPTPWPIVLALGITLAVMGIVTSWGLSYLGGVLIIAGCIGWFHDVFPHQKHEYVPIKHQAIEIKSTRRSVMRLNPHSAHIAWAPVQVHPIIHGIKAGIVGGIAMAIVAILFGVLRYHSIWYVPNLVGGAGLIFWQNPTLQEITHFRLSAFIFALIIDGAMSILVGVLYAALLPALARWPVFFGGIVAPLIWSFLIHLGIETINPYLGAHTQWLWFALSQVAFGLATSWMVTRETKYPGGHRPPLGIRFGIHTPGFEQEEREGE